MYCFIPSKHYLFITKCTKVKCYLTLKNSANQLYQDCVGVVWLDLIDSGRQHPPQLSSHFVTNIAKTSLLHGEIHEIAFFPTAHNRKAKKSTGKTKNTVIFLREITKTVLKLCVHEGPHCSF